jgi:hypothetical protein
VRVVIGIVVDTGELRKAVMDVGDGVRAFSCEGGHVRISFTQVHGARSDIGSLV